MVTNEAHDFSHLNKSSAGINHEPYSLRYLGTSENQGYNILPHTHTMF